MCLLIPLIQEEIVFKKISDENTNYKKQVDELNNNKDIKLLGFLRKLSRKNHFVTRYSFVFTVYKKLIVGNKKKYFLFGIPIYTK